jgi:hypothetical protein
MKLLSLIICFLLLVVLVHSTDAPKLEQDEAQSPASRIINRFEPYDWGIIYYMSYDNNLEPFGKGIIQAIRDGVKSSRTVAAVQADFSDVGGMHRYTIQSSGISEERITSDDSADEEQFIAYLNWFVEKYPSNRYIVVFLNHGGGIDEMCFDANPDTKGKMWMSGQVLGEKLRHFRDRMSGDWELLFLQQCGRGSLENLYSFRATANYIMSSPVNVGAPNTYYTALHKWLGENPNATGSEVAAKISAEDRDYAIYTCLRTSKLAELPGKLNAAIEPLLKVKTLIAPSHRQVIYSASEEVTYDARRQLEQLAVTNKIKTSSLLSFFKWTREDLFTNVWFRSGQEDSEYSGLSVFQPQAEADLLRHDNLELYKESKLSDLWKLTFSSRLKK